MTTEASKQRILGEQYREDAIPENEKRLIEERVQKLKLAMDSTIKATYTVRIVLLDSAAMTPTPGSIEVWKHGGREHVSSEMEQKLYFCPGKKLGVNLCEAIMPESGNTAIHHVCPRCGKTWKASEVIGELGGRLTRQNWAIALTNMVERLNREVELEGVVFQKGIREANLAEQLRDRRGDSLQQVMRKKKTVRYRFPNLMRDLNAGADLFKRMTAFLNSCSSDGVLPRAIRPPLPQEGDPPGPHALPAGARTRVCPRAAGDLLRRPAVQRQAGSHGVCDSVP